MHAIPPSMLAPWHGVGGSELHLVGAVVHEHLVEVAIINNHASSLRACPTYPLDTVLNTRSMSAHGPLASWYVT